MDERKDEDMETPFVRLERSVGGLTATVDQIATAQRNVDAMLLVFAFTVGVLGALVALQHRKLQEFAGALAG